MNKWDAQQAVRTNLAFSAFLLGAAILAAHLFFLQFDARASSYYQTKLQERWHSYECPQGKRGNILFSDGSILAGNRKVARVIVEPHLINDTKAVVERLAKYVDEPVEALLEKVEAHEGYGLVLADSVPLETALAIDREGLRGVFTRYHYVRFYPHGDYGAPATVGYAGREPVHRLGLEYTFDEHLSGRDGMVVYRKDADRKRLPGSELSTIERQDGTDLTTHLHSGIQQVCEAELRRATRLNKAQWGCVLVMRPQDGAVLGAATYPAFDPNEYAAGNVGDEFNVLVHRVVEPGSTVKPLLAAYAIERGWLELDQRFICNRALWLDGYEIREAELNHWLGDSRGVTVKDIIVNSSNIGMGRVALALGQERVLASYRAMGFFSQTGIELPAEAEGFEPYYYADSKKALKWPRITLANTGFGQGLAVTPIQLASAYCVIANGGYRIQPGLVEKTPADLAEAVHEGQTLPTGETLVADLFEPISAKEPSVLPLLQQAQSESQQRVLSAATCETITAWLVEVVESGTGKAAKLARCTAAGKTGTAQIPSSRGGYSNGAYTASFVGFFPAFEPHYVILVMFYRPRGEYYGGAVAAPVFKAVGDRITYITELGLSQVNHED